MLLELVWRVGLFSRLLQRGRPLFPQALPSLGSVRSPPLDVQEKSFEFQRHLLMAAPLTQVDAQATRKPRSCSRNRLVALPTRIQMTIQAW